jgi:hypothetical protein
MEGLSLETPSDQLRYRLCPLAVHISVDVSTFPGDDDEKHIQTSDVALDLDIISIESTTIALQHEV